MADAWSPAQYDRFKAERLQPALDLIALVDGLEAAPGGRAVDLGCGTGEITARLHERLRLRHTLGIDSSAAMLEQAPTVAGIDFRVGDLRYDPGGGPFDVVFANASLQWVPDHRDVLRTWVGLLAEGGRLAVQVPANADHPSHRLSAELATEEPFASALGGDPPPDPVLDVLPPEAYAETLFELGLRDQVVRLQVYGHVLDGPEQVVEWVKGTSLTRFRKRLPDDVYDAFVDEYRRRLLVALGDRRPYFYAFKRILFVARR